MSDFDPLRLLPLCCFYRDTFLDDRSNRSRSTTACLLAMLESCGLDIAQSSTSRIEHGGRAVSGASIRAVKSREPDTEFDDDVYRALRVIDHGVHAVMRHVIPTPYDVMVAREGG